MQQLVVVKIIPLKCTQSHSLIFHQRMLRVKVSQSLTNEQSKIFIVASPSIDLTSVTIPIQEEKIRLCIQTSFSYGVMTGGDGS